MKKLRFFGLLLWTLAAPVPAWADRGQELFQIFLDNLKPQRAQLILSGQPRENGQVPQLYIAVEGAYVRGMRIQSVAIKGYHVLTDPPEQWDSLEYPKVHSVLACHGQVELIQQDLNDFLVSRAFGSKREWEDVKVDFKDGRVNVSCYYRLDLKILSLRVKLELDTALEIKNGTELWLRDTRMRINNSEVSEALIRRALARLQPILDLDRFGLPLGLAKVEIQEDRMIIRSRRPARPFPGLLYSYPQAP